MPRVSVLIPSRNEQFLVPTVQDLLAKARGDVEICVCVEGYWPQPPIPDDPRVKILHHGSPKGMRPAINALAQIATGDYFLKSDAHCMWDEGWDLKLIQDYHEDNWMLIPRRYPLDPINWCTEQRTDHKYPIDYSYIVEPFHAYGDSTAGLHATQWQARREARKEIPIDKTLGSQGSAYFVSRKCWEWLGGLDKSLFGSFWFEDLELGMKAWLRGGAQMVTKNTHFHHLYKGKRFGRGYSTKGMGHENALLYSTWLFMTDQPLKGRTRTFRSLIEEFAPVPTWPEDLDEVFARARRECRNPYAVAA